MDFLAWIKKGTHTLWCQELEPWKLHVSFILRNYNDYNPYLEGLKPAFFHGFVGGPTGPMIYDQNLSNHGTQLLEAVSCHLGLYPKRNQNSEWISSGTFPKRNEIPNPPPISGPLYLCPCTSTPGKKAER